MQNQVLYWRGGSDLQLELIKEFKARGFSIKHARSIEDILKAVNAHTIVVVDANASGTEAIQKANQLALAEQLHSYPIMFISADALKRTETLRTLYKRLLAISTPFKADRIFSQVSELGNRPAESSLVDDANPSAAGSGGDAAPIVEVAKPAPRGPMDLVSRGNKLSDFSDSTLLPGHPKQSTIKQALDRLTQIDKWAGIHSRRVATISAAFSEQLDLAPERDINIRIVALLLNWGFNYSESESSLSPGALRKFDLFRDWQEPDIVQEIARGFDRTADFFRERLEDPMAAETVRAIASFMRSDNSIIPSYVAEDAQVAMLNEFTDRACWANGYWDPRGAHRVIKGLRTGSPFLIEGIVKDVVLQMLVDAVVARESLLGAPLPSMAQERSTDQIAEAQQKLDESRRLIREQPQQVELSALRPGMILSRPVISKSGKLLMSAKIRLDDDLIMRLWQLAALVPVRVPLWILPD